MKMEKSMGVLYTDQHRLQTTDSEKNPRRRIGWKYLENIHLRVAGESGIYYFFVKVQNGRKQCNTHVYD